MIIHTLMHSTAIAINSSHQGNASNLTHVVDCHGLTLDNLDPGRFRGELRSREAWIKDQCQGDYQIGPLRAGGRIVGRRFSFADMTEAAAFKVWFPIHL
jgi:hypothetical protein